MNMIEFAITYCQPIVECALIAGAFLGYWLMPGHDWLAPAVFTVIPLVWISYGLSVGPWPLAAGTALILPAEVRAARHAVTSTAAIAVSPSTTAPAASCEITIPGATLHAARQALTVQAARRGITVIVSHDFEQLLRINQAACAAGTWDALIRTADYRFRWLDRNKAFWLAAMNPIGWVWPAIAPSHGHGGVIGVRQG